jgi:vacuolar protein sorting-associated protein 35
MLVQLIRRLRGGDENPFGDDASATPKRILQLLSETVEVLSDVSAPDLALRLYLQCAQAANNCELETVAYEFFTKAYLLYEEEISVSEFLRRLHATFCKKDLDVAINFGCFRIQRHK